MADVPKDIMEAAHRLACVLAADYDKHVEAIALALLSERERRTAQGVTDEPMAWAATGSGLIRYVPDSRYRKFSPHIQSFYKPYRCSSCEAASLQPGEAHGGGE